MSVMSHLRLGRPVRRAIGANGQLPWPRWLKEMMRGSARQVAEAGITLWDQADLRAVRARAPRARHLPPAEFQAVAAELYGRLASVLSARPRRHAVRLWNFIPDIHRPCGDGMDRYMVFNVARHAACRRWLGDGFEQCLPTASGIGHDGEDLVIDALAAADPGEPVENPRQIPAYRYSRRYGPRPPCFARATVLPRHGLMLIGGTASVVGQDSEHPGDLAAQIHETLANLSALSGDLRRLTDLRVFHPRAEDAGPIGRTIGAALGAGARIELMRAELCRRELLVEIEGVARPPAHG